jgi:hypothetical protein
MPSFPRGRDNDLWFESADRPRDHLAGREIVDDSGIG